MSHRTGLIFACDTSKRDFGLHLIKQTAEHLDMVKAGLEAMMAEDKKTGETLARSYRLGAHALGKGVMWDGKFLDVSNTMLGAIRNVLSMGVRFFTIHAQASDAALATIAQVTADSSTKPLAVTILTDLDDPQCYSRFVRDSAQAVTQFATIAYENGIRGFVCSAHEARVIREKFADVTIVTPAIRPLWAVGKDEQKRVTTPTQAALAGADYIVVGRPISKPPLPYTYAQAAREIREELEAA